MTTGRKVHGESGRLRPRLFGSPVLRDRSAAAALEFALLLPILTTMLIGTFQYGILIFSYNTMLNTARNGARAMAVGSATEAEVVDTARMNLPGWVPPAQWTIVAKDVATTGTNEVITTITVQSRYAALLNFVPMPRTIDVAVVMQKES